MFENLHIAHIDGSAVIKENLIHTDTLTWRKPRTISQMFFQPYESRQEFVFCARHTFLPIALIALTLFDPLILVTIPLILGGAILGLATIGGLSKILDSSDSKGIASYSLNLAESIFAYFCQAIIDVLVVPLSALLLCTRSISTALKATGLYDYNALEVSSPSIP